MGLPGRVVVGICESERIEAGWSLTPVDHATHESRLLTPHS
jgi:hypothetical protein